MFQGQNTTFSCCCFSVTVTSVTCIPEHSHKRAAVSMQAASLKQNSLIPEPCPFPQFIRLLNCKGIKIKWAWDRENKPDKKIIQHKNITIIYIYIYLSKRECMKIWMPFSQGERRDWMQSWLWSGVRAGMRDTHQTLWRAKARRQNAPLLGVRGGALRAEGSSW